MRRWACRDVRPSPRGVGAWTYDEWRCSRRFAPVPRVISNNQLTITQLTLAGCGLSFNVVPEIAHHLRDGRLVRVLPRWSAPTLSVDALMLPRATQPAKVRAALDAFATYFAALE